MEYMTHSKDSDFCIDLFLNTDNGCSLILLSADGTPDILR